VKWAESVAASPLRRQRIQSLFRTGIKAIDTFMPCGRGTAPGNLRRQRRRQIDLVGMMASQAEADVNVIALIGERVAKFREFLEKDLDEVGRRKSASLWSPQ